jgi:hypothetical protein
MARASRRGSWVFLNADLILSLPVEDGGLA